MIWAHKSCVTCIDRSKKDLLYSYQFNEWVVDSLEAACQDRLQQNPVGPVQLAQGEGPVGEPQQSPYFIRAAGIVHLTQIQLDGEVVSSPFETDLQTADLRQYVWHGR